ncbi:MAG: branched-chain amino acid ABC transporter permease [Anaerolineae bacterium]|jgi:branched-chain amino acid transport system permease protein|nr:branched-chain amino acid ABC transporter permease [Anaerolineae bacterium]
MNDFLSTYGFLLIQALFAAILGLSLYLPLLTGQLSLASPGFYAIGGYISAVFATQIFNQFYQPFLLPIPASIAPNIVSPMLQTTAYNNNYPILFIFVQMGIAAVVCLILAGIIGFLAIRLRGIYLALATIAFVEVVRTLAEGADAFGGSSGIFGIPQPFVNKFDYAWVAIPMLIITLFIIYRLEHGKIGRAFRAIREDELSVSASGVYTTYYKVIAFALGGMLAGMVGAIYAHFLNTWNPRQGTFDAGVLYLTFVVVGGSRTIWGPVLAAIVLTILPEALRSVSGAQWLTDFLQNGRLILYGGLLTAAALFFPQGVITPRLLSRLNFAKRMKKRVTS